MSENLKGLEFDPGFAPFIFAFRGTIEYLYADINKYRNLSQKKMKFLQYNKKFIELFNNNLGFYVGCLLWAAYIKAQPEQNVLNNPCLGEEYDEENNTFDIDFEIRFVELFPKDMKYFLGKDFKFDESDMKILKLYREFLIINKGFVDLKKNTEIKLPESLKFDEVESFKEKIENVIKAEDLSRLLEYKELLCQI